MATVAQRQRISNSAVLVTTSPHGFLVGNEVLVADVGAGFDGTFTLTGVTADKLEYDNTGPDVGLEAATGTVTLTDVSLTPAEVQTLTGETVTQDDIDVAANVITSETGNTPTEHRDLRNIPEANVKRAWAIVSVRVRDETRGGDEQTGITSESQDDYSYSKDASLAAKFVVYPNKLAGLPLVLLDIGPSFTARAINPLPESSRTTTPPVRDDFGVVQPPRSHL